jgi:putative DNA methylase
VTEYKKKLIEVALPLEAINRESAREKSIRHGHPSTLHLWWARRPLAACRAVLFASLVDDPSAHPDQFPTEEDQEQERQRLFRIIEELVLWENSANETVLEAARAEIMRSTDGNPPPVLDPFCGGGSIPLEAQRLGLEAHASDLNPVAVLITKALIEIPPKFAGLPPVNPESHAKLGNTGWRGARGLAEDVRFYGRWMRDQAEQRIGHLYPKVKLPAAYGGGEATVIAWLWARTVKCPNPACGADMPLVRSFALSTKKGKQAWIEPVVDVDSKSVRFMVREGTGTIPEGTKLRGRSRCLLCGSDNIADSQLREQASLHGIGHQLMATVVNQGRSRRFLPADHVGSVATPNLPDLDWLESSLPANPRWFSRQLVTLTTMTGLLSEVHSRIVADAERVVLDGVWPVGDSSRGQRGGASAHPEAYANAVLVYLAFGIDKMTTTNSALCGWQSDPTRLIAVYGRQAIPMTWDWAEANPFSGAAGDYLLACGSIAEVLDQLVKGPLPTVQQLDAASLSQDAAGLCMIATDPPYYDNIGYSDLSDYFYLWLRRALSRFQPQIFSTIRTPKQQELIADPYRWDGDSSKAEDVFEQGLSEVFRRFISAQDSSTPLTLFYAFRQAEVEDESGGLVSTGWERMLAALLRSGLSIVGTWPVRTELTVALKKRVGALASSVVVVCRPREKAAPLATRREFLTALQTELPPALTRLQHGNIAPVDLAQASIGPGMAVFSRYSKVLEADGFEMSVRSALGLINQALGEILAEQEGEFDPSTRWAIAWFEQFGIQVGEFGVAETLCKAKNCSVQSMVHDGFLEAKGGKVRLLRRDELDENWDPATDQRLTVWEMTQHLIGRLDEGEAAAAALARQLGSYAEVARDLAYRLYLVCERKKWSQEGQAYNALVVAWPGIMQLAAAGPAAAAQPQTSMDL